MGSVAVVCSSLAVVHGILAFRSGTDLCPLYWKADLQPLNHQGSPYIVNLIAKSKHALIEFFKVLKKKDKIIHHTTTNQIITVTNYFTVFLFVCLNFFIEV